MRKLFFFIFLIWPPLKILVTNNDHGLMLMFKNLKSNKGLIQGAIYNQSKGWPNSPYALQYFSIELEKASIVINNNHKMLMYFLPISFKNGKYAISCFHDENKNNQLDTNFLGIPKEGYGFSNYFSSALRIPSFDECSFNLEEGKKKNITIMFKYLSLS